MTDTKLTANFLGHALSYAARGMSVFPLKPRSKRPLTLHGFKDATTDPAQIVAWWTATPNANIGIATGAVSGIAVLDVDSEEAGLRLMKLSTVSEDISWQDTVLAVTGRPNGVHYLFTYSEQVPQGGAKRIGDGLDVKSDGGYIVAPPSIHPNGSTYSFVGEHRKLQPWPSWLKPPENEPLRTTERRVPDRAGVAVRADRYVEAALRGKAAELAAMAPDSGRNNKLNAATYDLRKRFVDSGALPASVLVDTMLEAARASGLPDIEAKRTIRSAMTAP